MGSYNRKQCQNCETFIYDADTYCPTCSTDLNRCSRCGESYGHMDDCVFKINNKVSDYVNGSDISAKVAYMDSLIDCIDQLTVKQFMQLPATIRNAYEKARLYTKENGYNVNR